MNRNHKQCKNHPNWKQAQQDKIKRIEQSKYNRISIYNLNPKTCQHCKKELAYDKRKNKFCSSSCSASHNNHKRGYENPPKIGNKFNRRLRQYKNCAYCDSLMFTVKNKYCSLICSAHHRSEVAFDKNQMKTNVQRSTQRGFLMRKHGHKCSMCNRTEWNGQPIPIELDHIDGCAANNKEENLRLLCPNCHAQTPTYKARNKGNGRQSLGMISS